MLGWSINLFRIRGIQLALHGSFLLLLASDDAPVKGASSDIHLLSRLGVYGLPVVVLSL
jgi:hypothetical protein